MARMISPRTLKETMLVGAQGSRLLLPIYIETQNNLVHNIMKTHTLMTIPRVITGKSNRKPKKNLAANTKGL